MGAGRLMLTLLTPCDVCHSPEERLFRDTWTGLELCIGCLVGVIEDVTLSPSEGDNLATLLEVEE